jgi:FixJ family two-component response regulator
MPLGKRTIAIVEDDASFRRALERLLRAFGFDAHTLASAEEFLRGVAPESHCLPNPRSPTVGACRVRVT